MPLPSFDIEHAPILNDYQKQVAERIGNIIRTHKRGESNAVKSEAIEKAMNVKGSTLRAMIRYLRTEKKLPICSSGKGYFWATSQSDIDKCRAHLRARRDSIDNTLREMEGVRV